MSPHLFIFQVMCTLTHQMQIEVGQQRRKRVWIKRLEHRFACLPDAPAVARRRNRQHGIERKSGFEESFRGNAQGRNRIRVALEDYRRFACPWKKCSHDKPLRVAFPSDVWSEQAEWVR